MTNKYDTEKIKFAYLIIEAIIQTHTLTLLIIIAFPQQQCLHQRAYMLRYTHIACFVLSVALKHFTKSDGFNQS
jgi:hypothetical protein